MRTLKFAFLLSILAFFGCKSEINITDPSIQIESSGVNYFAYDSLSIYVIQSADIDGSTVPAEYFEWTITQNGTGKTVFYQYANADRISWFPTEKGKYIISVKIGYDGNKSITKIKDIVLRESPKSLLTKISGKWRGAGETIFATFNVDYLNVNADGSFQGSASNWVPNYPYAGVFYMHQNKNNGGTNAFVINGIDDFGNVNGYVVLRHNPGDSGYRMCLKTLRTNATNDSLYVAVDEDHSCNVYPWYVRHALVRVQ